MSQHGTDEPTPPIQRDDAPPPARDRALMFPIRLRCQSMHDLLAADGLEDAVAEVLGRAFDRAGQALPAADVVGGGVVLQPPYLAKGEGSQDELAKLFGHLTRAIEQAARSQSLQLRPVDTTVPTSSVTDPRHASPARPAAKPVQAESWRIQIQVDFHTTPRRFFEIRTKYARHQDGGSNDPADPMDLYFAILDEPVQATAWVVEVLSEREFQALSGEILRRFSPTRKPTEFVWSIHGWGELRTLIAEADRDHRVAARIPDFSRRGFVEDRPGPATGDQQTIMRPGAWTLSVFLPLPNLALGDIAELGPDQTVDVPLSDVAALGTAEAFAAEAGLDRATAIREAPQVPVTVVVTPFTIRRRTHERTLAALFARYRQDMFGVQLGAVMPYTEAAMAALGSTLRPFVGTVAAATLGRDQDPAAGFWPPGAAGANLTPLVDNVRKQALRTANAAFIAAEADRVQRILQTENSFWRGPDRDDALRDFIVHWAKVNDSELFGLLLDALHQRGTLDAFVSSVRGLPSTYTYFKRVIVELADGDPRFSDVAQDIERLARGSLDNHYDVPAQEVWLRRDPTKTVRAANGRSDDKAGVVAEAEPYYAESARILQPKPEILERLREPTRKKVSELIGRMVCRPGERLTREELLQKATQEAAKELPPLEEKDLIKVTLVKSIRVLRIEQRWERGIDEIYVHYQPVQKVGDNPWMPAGDVIVALPAAFEASLTAFHVQHLEHALTVFAMAEAVVLGGVMILEIGVATIGQLFFFVSMQVVVYHFSTDVEDRTLEGYLGAALKGELDAVGFKGLSGAVKQLGSFSAGQLITRELVSQVATKWIVFGLRGVATATGVGGMEATYQFGEDLLRYSHCEGWSNPGQYWDRFKAGFVMTLAFEFLAVPILAPPVRLALEKASTALEAARALRATGLSLRELTGLLLKGAEGVESAIGETVQHGASPALTRGFRQRVGDVLQALGREYESRAYQSLLELYAAELSGAAAGGLRRLLRMGGERQVDALLQRALAAKRSLPELLSALGRMEQTLLADLVQAGKLAEVATLDEASLRLLQQLHGAKVKIGSLFDGSGPSLRKFGDEFAKLSEAQRVAALENAAGRTPTQVLEQSQAPVKPPEAVPASAKPATLDDILQVLQSKGFTSDDLRAFAGPGKKSAALARRVARLLERYTPEEVQAFGKFLSKRKVRLNDKTVEQFLEEVPKGELEAKIAELELELAEREQIRADEDAPQQIWSEKELAEQEGVTIDSTERRPPRVSPDDLEEPLWDVVDTRGGRALRAPGLEEPLWDVVDTPGSRALRASLIARDGGVLPQPGYHAHHIVPEKDFAPGLDWLRDSLADAGCGINDAGNGVFLAGSRAKTNPELTRLHNSYIHAGKKKEYAYTLTRELYGQSGAALLAKVEEIGEKMATGDFKILEIPHGWKTKWEPGMTAPADPAVEPEWIE